MRKLAITYICLVFLMIAVYATVHAGKKKSDSKEPWESEPCTTCSIVHKPHAGCPNGTGEKKDFFTEKDGSHKDACIRSNGDGAIDVLIPGEGVEFHIEVELPDPPPQNKS